MMRKDQIRDAAILIYIVGNALTFNHLIRGTGVIQDTGQFTVILIESLLISTVWPVYWLVRMFAG